MSLYKILIVDDEEEIRCGIIKKIKWEENGFQIVGEAQNGIEALEKAQSLQPDIIMTDVKMPYMDGLELGECITKLMPSTKIIIFSGCDDFEYAQKAIRINVIEYVLKPINSAELVEILKKLKTQLDDEDNLKKNIDILKKYYDESLPIMRDQLLIASIEGKVIKDELNTRLTKVGIEFENKYFSVGVINFDFLHLNNEGLKENPLLIPISIQQILNDIMKNICQFKSFLYLDKIIIIANIEDSNLDALINGLNEVCRNTQRILNINLSIGVGRVINAFEDIHLSYKDAISALEYKVILGNGKVIFIEDVEPDTTSIIVFDELMERKFIDTIKIGSSEDICKIVDEVFNINIKKMFSINEYKVYEIEVLTTLIKTIKAYNLSISEILGKDFQDYLYLNNLNSIEEVKEWFKEKAIKINIAIRNERINSSKILIDKAKKYIYENYNDYELSVDNVCSELHLSPAYFSTLFKKETNISFVNFITDVRLEEAVNLLNTTDYKTCVIADKVGYQDANYFSYVFKKKYGISPTRYRKR